VLVIRRLLSRLHAAVSPGVGRPADAPGRARPTPGSRRRCAPTQRRHPRRVGGVRDDGTALGREDPAVGATQPVLVGALRPPPWRAGAVAVLFPLPQPPSPVPEEPTTAWPSDWCSRSCGTRPPRDTATAAAQPQATRGGGGL